MAASREFIAFIAEQIAAGFGPVAVKRMFSGAGFFRNDLMFALVAGDAFYLKTDDAGRAAFEAEGLGPFTYMKKDGEHTLTSYYRAPARCLDDSDEMREWCSRAYGVAMAKARPKAKTAGAAQERRMPRKR